MDNQIKIDSEFAELIPPLTDREFSQLEENILKDGCREPLIVWQEQGILVDGHNRYRICAKHSLAYKVESLSFQDRTDVIIWMLGNQLGRRNLTDFHRVEIHTRRSLLIRDKAKQNQGTRTDLLPNLVKGEIESINTQEEIAKAANVSKGTVHSAQVVIEKGTDELKSLARTGAVSVSAAAQVAKLPVQEQQKIVAQGPAAVKQEAKVIRETPKEVALPKMAAPVAKPEQAKQKPIHNFLSVDDWVKLSDQEKGDAILSKGASKFNETNDNIEWARWSWNPVTGCLHGCDYCYARDIATRFYEYLGQDRFRPVFYPERLQAPKNTSFPDLDKITDPIEKLGKQNVFVCSMADLFGKWVPSEWIEAILQQVRDNPQWNFLFLTKFPIRMSEFDYPDNAWLGTTVDKQWAVERAEKAFRKLKGNGYNGIAWLSCEPMLEKLTFTSLDMFDWVVAGGASKSTQTAEFYPPFDWIVHLWQQAQSANCKFYMKTNLLERVRQYPTI